MAHTFKGDKINQPTHQPTRKVTTAIGGSVFGIHIVEWIANDLFGWSMPELVAADIAIGIAGAVAWFVKNRA